MYIEQAVPRGMPCYPNLLSLYKVGTCRSGKGYLGLKINTQPSHIYVQSSQIPFKEIMSEGNYESGGGGGNKYGKREKQNPKLSRRFQNLRSRSPLDTHPSHVPRQPVIRTSSIPRTGSSTRSRRLIRPTNSIPIIWIL